MNAAFEFLLWMTVFFFVVALAGWWSDRQMRRDDLPPPDPRTIAGESHKPWM